MTYSMRLPEPKLKSILEESGLVNKAVFESAQNESKRSNQSVADVLIGRGDISEDYFYELVSRYLNIPLVDFKKIEAPYEIVELLPEAFAKSKDLILFGRDKDKKIIKVAMADPLDYDTIEFLRAKFNAWVELYLATPTSLKYGLRRYKKKIGFEFNEIISENVKKFLSAGGEADLAKLAEAVPIITILDSVIEHAIALSSSDIHFEPLNKEVLVRYRVDGILHEILSLNKAIEPILVARVKILANLQIDEHKTPQDGRFRFEIESGGNIVDVRVNIMPTMHGEKVEMRLLKSSNRPLTIEELGVSKEAAKIVQEEIKKPHGMILVTGPTGHGKTTTLYAILHILNRPEVNIVTVEDPIEYEILRVNQTQVNPKAGITFANGLRSLLRQNPDIIMIGEIRDTETVDIAVHSALTGHLVLSSLHTNDAPSALPRLLDMGAPAFLLASTVNMVIAQRLVRKICKSCVESYDISPEIKKLITAQFELSGESKIKKVPKSLYRGKGCKVCGNSGFQGQIGIFEILKTTDSIRDLILKKSSASEIRKLAIKEGMATMFEDGLNKVEKGITTVEEIIRVVRE